MGLRWPSITRGDAPAPDSTRGVVIVGPVGVGKTTLARSIASQNGHRALWAVGTESSRDVPLGAFAHLVDIGANLDPDTVLANARRDLGRAGATVVVDDADLLDPISTMLVRQLIEDRSVRLIVTLGDGAPSSGLLEPGLLERIDLSAFTCDESAQVIEAALDGPLDHLSADWLWEVSEGNPLYLRHLVEGSWESGLLYQVGGIWQIRSRPVVTAELATLLESRLLAVTPDALEVLRLLAFGGVIDVEVLHRAASADAVAAAHRSGHLRSGPDGTRRVARLSHPILGQVLREQTGALSARSLRGRLVRALAEVGAVGDRLLLATLSLDSDAELDAELLADAAERALALCDYPLAERLARSALAHGSGFSSAMVAARAMTWQGRTTQAHGLVAEFDPGQMSEPDLLTWGLWRSTALFFGNEQAAARHELAELRSRGMSSDGQDVVTSAEITFDFFANEVPRAIELTGRLFDADRCAPLALVFAGSTGGSALARAGHAEHVPAIAARSRAAAKTTGFMLGHTQIGVAEVFAATLSGNLSDIDTVLERYSSATSLGRSRWVIEGYVHGLARLATGRLADAEEQFRRAIAAAEHGGPRMWIALCSIGLCQALGARGQPDAAAEALVAAEGAFGDSISSFEPDLILARAWILAARDEHREAIALARKAAATARAGSMFGVEVIALHTAVRFGDLSAAGRLRRLTRQVFGPLVSAAALQAHALESHDGAGLIRAANELEQMGANLSAADAAAQAAAAHRRAGDARKEHAAAATAHRLADLCGAAHTPALDALANPTSLTARERVVAALIITGLTNREIAERLTLSVRTVEGHVYRMFAKLGVADRESLATELSEQR